jgi:hypothetical protein
MGMTGTKSGTSLVDDSVTMVPPIDTTKMMDQMIKG